MDDGTAPHGMDDTLIPLEPAIIDDRGVIQPLLEAHIRSALLISSKKGAVRADHYHHTDWHYLYVIKGRMAYWHRRHGDDSPPKLLVVEAGQMVFTPPLVEHRTDFLEDTVCMTLSRNVRDQASYEADVVRLKMPVPEGGATPEGGTGG